MMKHKFLTATFILGVIVLYSIPAKSQDLDALLDKETKPQTDYVTATFKSTRIVNGHSIERMKKKQLEFRVSHRFDPVNSGSYNFYGLDYGRIHLALEYGLTDWLEVGIGRSSYDKTYDAFGKVSILRQSKGVKNMPIHLSYLFSTEYISSNDDTLMNNATSRMSFVNQLLIARKINEQISFQITPTYIHRNLVPTEIDKNDLFALGVGGRYKLTKRMAFNVEYFYVYRPNANSLNVKYYNPLSVGIDIETGGHVFQIMLTNSIAMREGGFIGKTTDSWSNGGIRLGFNISRVFSFTK
ncbi:MAG TPA: DUF5777 family beta-barrel protein [Prolixibacteraceae bacterium]|jgi:hypothetical protein